MGLVFFSGCNFRIRLIEVENLEYETICTVSTLLQVVSL